MSKPRYSIIPGGAVIDQRLEPRDLHVLCFLGIHTDKLGWCFLTQGRIAKALGCSRASIQRSLARLAEFEWIEVRSSASAMTRAHACHAYRVRMDRDDPGVEPSELEVDEQEREVGCPPVNTPAHTGRARVPNKDGHGGAHTYVGTERPSLNDQESPPRAREIISSDAIVLANEFYGAIGVDPKNPELDGMSGVPYQAAMWLERGYDRALILATAANVSARDGPRKPLSYFLKAIEGAQTERATAPEKTHHGKPNDGGFKGALGRLGERIRELEGGISQSGEPSLRLIPDGGRERS